MMPDELTVAIQAAIARARERCPACEGAGGNHLCHGDLKVLEDALLAAVAESGGMRQTAAEIERQFGLLGSERGKE